MWSWRNGIAVGTAAACLALAGMAPASATTTSGWRIVYRTPEGNYEINGLTAPATNDAWAFGTRFSKDAFKGTFYLHWAGQSWQRFKVPQPAGFAAVQISSSSPDNVWVVGSTGTEYAALVFNGAEWTTMPAPSDGLVAPVASNDVWVFAGSGCSPSGAGFSCITFLDHWNGTTWTSSTLPVYGLDLVSAGQHVWLTAAADVTKYGPTSETGREALFRWSGSQWQAVTAPDREITGDVPAVASPGGKLWLLAENAHASRAHLDYWNGRRWSHIRASADASRHSYVPMSYDGHRGFWDGPVHWTGTEWVQTVRLRPEGFQRERHRRHSRYGKRLGRRHRQD